LNFVIPVLLGIVAFLLLVRLLPRRITVYEYQAGLLYRNGVFQKTLGGGTYFFMPPWRQIELVDLRQTLTTIGGQEVLSSDNIALKVSITCFYNIEDAALAQHQTVSYQDTLYAQLQRILRELISSRTVEQVLAERSLLSQALLEGIQPLAKAYGVMVTDASLKDLTFPGELKKIFAEVMRAQKEGLAALERARGETAALRALANTAKLLETHPALMNLRALQALNTSTGGNTTLVYGLAPFTGSPPS
jgi:regulator of protease activity HflC (stomatin/prohibitin superfamily)